MVVFSADLKGSLGKICIWVMTRSIQGGRRVGGLRCPPPSSPFSATQPLKLYWCCIYNNHKKETLGELRAMNRWRDEGGEGSDAGNRGACVWVGSFGVFFFFFCLCPSWSPVFLWSHAALCIIPQLWVTGHGVKPRQQGQISTRAVWLCVFSLPVFSDSSRILCPVTCFDFTLWIMIRFVFLFLNRGQTCTHYTSPKSLILLLTITTAHLILTPTLTQNRSKMTAILPNLLPGNVT